MPIYDKLNLVFIHITKTAGMSIHGAIRSSVGLKHDKLKELNSSAYSQIHPCHFNLRELNYLEPEKIKNYFKFSVVRNPFSRLVSEYEHMKRKNISRICNKDASFTEFILAINHKWTTICSPNNNQKHKCRYITQRSYLINDNNEIGVDKIFRFENFKEIEDFILEKGNGKKIGKSHYFGERPPDTQYYTKETEKIVQDLYREDFETFNYPDCIF